MEYNLGRIQSALRDFERATQALPAFLPAQIGRESVLLALGRYDQAMVAAEETVKLYPRDPRTLYLKALVQARMGRRGCSTRRRLPSPPITRCC